MSSSYSPTAEFTDSTTVLADGDAANATNLNAAPKKALDRAAYLRAATDGLLVWRGNARVDSGGASSGNTGVYCPPIEAVSLLDGSTWRAFSLSSETQLTTAAHFGGGTLAAATAYYVYAYVSGGVLALQISADAPGADGIWKNGATGTHRYLFSFFTDSSGGANGVAIPMRRTAGGRARPAQRVPTDGAVPTSMRRCRKIFDARLPRAQPLASQPERWGAGTSPHRTTSRRPRTAARADTAATALARAASAAHDYSS